MKSLKNRILSGIMAGALALSLAVPALADNETVITGTYVNTPIAVTVPTTGTAQINPYGLDVKLADNTSKISGNQIVTMPLAIINNSEMTLSVGASVTGEAKGDFLFGTAATNLTTTKTKTGIVYLQVKADSSLGDTDQDNNVTTGIALKDASLDPLFEDWGEFVKPTTGSKDLLLKAGSATTGTDLAILDPIDPATSSGHEKIGGVALFRLAGEVVASPTEPWATTDGFTATVAFTFSPVKTYTVTVDSANVTGGTAAVDKTSAPAGATVTITGTQNNTENTATYTVTAADGSTVTVTPDPDNALNGSFVMPAQNVTITGALT